jgi:predicted signal transduction protein with EAL and GGDEF domain
MISASIGISIYPKDGASTRELLISADSAMYRSKNSGRNRFSFFSNAVPSPDSSFHGFPTMEKAMRHALLENQFFLDFASTVHLFGVSYNLVTPRSSCSIA